LTAPGVRMGSMPIDFGNAGRTSFRLNFASEMRLP
jgi:hypothetical protein